MTRTQLLFAKNGHSTISWFNVPTVVHNSATMWPIREIVNFTMDTQSSVMQNNKKRFASGLCLIFGKTWHFPIPHTATFSISAAH
jgi:hypothetical protein